jgi:hypothetical protein
MKCPQKSMCQRLGPKLGAIQRQRNLYLRCGAWWKVLSDGEEGEYPLGRGGETSPPSSSCSSTSWLHEASCFLCHMLSAASSPQTPKQHKTISQNKIFFFLSWLSQVFCKSNGNTAQSRTHRLNLRFLNLGWESIVSPNKFKNSRQIKVKCMPAVKHHLPMPLAPSTGIGVKAVIDLEICHAFWGRTTLHTVTIA